MVAGGEWTGATLGEAPAGVVSLEIPIPVVIEQLRRLFPDKRRAGWIYNPARPGPLPAALRESARRLGWSLEVVECREIKDLLGALASMANRVDFVICSPDGALYNRASVEQLVMASLRRRLPLVGFSESFVRAGAAVGVYPDFEDIGRQTGELATRFLQGELTGGLYEPRRVIVAVNERVIRLLGLEPATRPMVILR